MDRSVPADQFKGQVLPTSSPVHRAVEHLASLSPSLYLLVLLRQPFVFLSCKYEPFTLASSRHRLHALGHDVIGLPQRGNSITVSSFRPNGINGSFVGVTSCTKLVSRLLCANTSHALYCAITRIQVWNSFLYTKRHKTASARPRAMFVSRSFHAITPGVS